MFIDSSVRAFIPPRIAAFRLHLERKISTRELSYGHQSLSPEYSPQNTKTATAYVNPRARAANGQQRYTLKRNISIVVKICHTDLRLRYCYMMDKTCCKAARSPSHLAITSIAFSFLNSSSLIFSAIAVRLEEGELLESDTSSTGPLHLPLIGNCSVIGRVEGTGLAECVLLSEQLDVCSWTWWTRFMCSVRLSFLANPLLCLLQVETGQLKVGALCTSRLWRVKSPEVPNFFSLQPAIVHLNGRVCLFICFL